MQATTRAFDSFVARGSVSRVLPPRMGGTCPATIPGARRVTESSMKQRLSRFGFTGIVLPASAAAVLLLTVTWANAQTPASGASTRSGTPAAGTENPPLEFLPPEQLPAAAKFAGPEDPEYVAWS